MPTEALSLAVIAVALVVIALAVAMMVTALSATTVGAQRTLSNWVRTPAPAALVLEAAIVPRAAFAVEIITTLLLCWLALRLPVALAFAHAGQRPRLLMNLSQIVRLVLGLVCTDAPIVLGYLGPVVLLTQFGNQLLVAHQLERLVRDMLLR